MKKLLRKWLGIDAIKDDYRPAITQLQDRFDTLEAKFNSVNNRCEAIEKTLIEHIKVDNARHKESDQKTEQSIASVQELFGNRLDESLDQVRGDISGLKAAYHQQTVKRPSNSGKKKAE